MMASGSHFWKVPGHLVGAWEPAGSIPCGSFQEIRACWGKGQDGTATDSHVVGSWGMALSAGS